MTLTNRFPTLFLTFVTALMLCLATAAQAAGQFAAVTVDARTGSILYDSDSNGLRHPASLTKMMTLYIVFQELKAKRITLKTPLRVSARAAGMAPSKLGLKPGSSITVDQAIRALVIKSANDVAATVAENLGGSESAFANRMTRVARSLGMSRTTYLNASGLPNSRQITTARDQATLGLRLMRDFPQYYPYFRSTQFNFRGKIIRSHNRLVGRFAGTDGIKTGYVNASGFNLVTSTRRGDKRLVGVVLGGKTAGRRDAYMMSMLSKAFARAKAGSTVAAIAGSSKGAADPIKLLKSKNTQVTGGEPHTDSEALAEASDAAAQTPQSAQVAQDQPTPQDSGAVVRGQPVVLEASMDGETTEAAPEPQIRTPGTKLPFAVKKAATQADVDGIAVASLPEIWAVEIGDFKTRKSAADIATRLKWGHAQKTAGVDSKTIAVKRDGKTLYRLLVSGYDEDTAKKSCAKVAKLGKDCAVLSPQG
jgi:D-alanyl-D-alanine carboxypeptidase